MTLAWRSDLMNCDTGEPLIVPSVSSMKEWGFAP